MTVLHNAQKGFECPVLGLIGTDFMKQFILMLGFSSLLWSVQGLANCETEYRDCLSLITTSEDCMMEKVNRCVVTCSEYYDYMECVDRRCRPEHPLNMRVWGPECRREYKEAARECLKDKNDCYTIR